MGRFVTLDGARTGPAIHVVDPGVPLDTLITDPIDVWRTQPAVRKVVDFIARNLASIPIHVYQRHDDEGRDRVRKGGLAEILGEPAPFTTPYRFWHTIHCDGLLFDRWAFVRLDRTDTEPEMLFRLPPGRFRIKRGLYNQPERLIVWPKDGGEYRLDPATAVFDSGYSTAWNNVTPPIVALADTLYEASEARKYRRQLLKNSARVEHVIERPAGEKWDDAAWNRFKSQFASYRAGGGDEGGTPILEDGMTMKKVEAFSPEKMETIEARKLTDAEVASFFHVPPEMVGAREGNYSNLDAFRQMLWNITLGPQIVAWEQTLNVMLRPMYEKDSGVYVEAHVDAKLRGSFLEQASAYQSSVGAPIMTRNEARAQRNMPAVVGGDEIITPLNVLVGGLASPRDTGPGSGGSGGGATGTPNPVMLDADDIAKRANAAGILIRSGFDPAAALDAVGLDPIEHLGLLPVTVQKPVNPDNVDEALVEEVTKADVLRWAATRGKAPRPGVKATRPDLPTSDQERALFDARIEAYWLHVGTRILEQLDLDVKAMPDVATLFNIAEHAAAVEPIIRAHMLRLAQIGAWNVLAEWDPDSEDWSPEMVEAWVAKAAQTNSDRWAVGMYRGLAAAAATQDPEGSLVTFLTGAALALALVGAFATEAKEFGGWDAARKTGLGTKTWHVRSQNPRPSHAALDGVTVPIGDIFDNGLRWPGDHFGDASENANCTCELTYGKG